MSPSLLQCVSLLPLLAFLATAAPTPTAIEASKTLTDSILKRDSNAVVTGSVAVNSINNNDGIGAGSNTKRRYTGDGSTRAGWPSKSNWVSFVDMFNNNKPTMFSSCSQYGVPNDSGPEVGAIYDGIQAIAAQSKLDHRLILAVIMEESSGCVRVPTTTGPYRNPGLMQDFEGYYTCNHGGGNVDTPCPTNTIKQMIREGAVGTDTGDGLTSNINTAQTRYGCSGAQCFYMAARLYNSGSIPASRDLSAAGSNPDYASDIANRLTGWIG